MVTHMNFSFWAGNDINDNFTLCSRNKYSNEILMKCVSGRLQISKVAAVIFPGCLDSPERPRCSTDHYTEMQECSTGMIPTLHKFLYWSQAWPLAGLILNRHLRIWVIAREDGCGWDRDHFCLMWKVTMGWSYFLNVRVPHLLFQPYHC